MWRRCWQRGPAPTPRSGADEPGDGDDDGHGHGHGHGLGDGNGDDDGDAYSDDHHGWSGHPGGGVGGVTALSRCQLCLDIEMFYANTVLSDKIRIQNNANQNVQNITSVF